MTRAYVHVYLILSRLIVLQSISLPISKYSKVCGKMIAYQVGSPNTFADYTGSFVRVNASIDTTWMVLVSLTGSQDATFGHLLQDVLDE